MFLIVGKSLRLIYPEKQEGGGKVEPCYPYSLGQAWHLLDKYIE